MAVSQLSTDEKMLDQIETFKRTGPSHGLLATKGGKVLDKGMEVWIPAFREVLRPADVSADFKAKKEPHQLVFNRTHELLANLLLILHGWTRLKEKEVEVEAVTGVLRISENDEIADAENLRVVHAAFLQFFGAAGLPPELSTEAVRKQLVAHKAAHEAMIGPQTIAVFRGAQSQLTTLRRQGLGYWRQMHNLLDGEYGEGAESFNAKSLFGYDRRLKGLRHKKKNAAAPTKDAKEKGKDGAEGGETVKKEESGGAAPTTPASPAPTPSDADAAK